VGSSARFEGRACTGEANRRLLCLPYCMRSHRLVADRGCGEVSIGSRIVVRSRWAESDFCCCRDRLRMETVSVGERLSDVKPDHSSP
jgi:hypothetical protein